MTIGFLIIGVGIVAYSLVGKRLSSSFLTAPIVFLGIGFGLAQTGLISPHDSETFLHPVAEVTLAILLFLDAAQTDLNALRRRHIWPLRMLLVGLPLMVVAGTVVAMMTFPSQPVVLLALLAAILAPTDAALGQAVVVNKSVPERARRALTVESGLNDGLALPLVLFLAAMTIQATDQTGAEWLVFGVKQVVLGPIVGCAVGLFGGWAIMKAKAGDVTSEVFEGVYALGLVAVTFVAAGLVGGNGFIAAFVAGLAFGAVVKGRCNFIYEFTEGEGQLLTWLAFLLVGAALVPEAVAHLSFPMLAYILLSLMVLRPLAIWLSLLGTDASGVSRGFFGWFGPRGLATALFALIAIEHLPHAQSDFILFTAINAVWISAILHGVTAGPLSNLYARRIAAKGPCAETVLTPNDPTHTKQNRRNTQL
ncbi:MAG: cation:proton antiporter [Octadecabacter sp.]|nr:cation:proton antiporter [Octadecabacter sp.]